MSSDIRRAAIVLMSLPQEEAAQLMAKLKPKQVEAVSIEIAKLGRLSPEEQERAIISFAEANPSSLAGGSGGLEVAKSLLMKALGKNAAATLETVQQSVEGVPFGFLRDVDPQNLLTFVNDEHPQTIALILSHLPAAYGAQVIAGLSPESQLQVIRRIAHMGQTSPEILDKVEEGLETRMSALVNQSYEHAGGVPAVAEILNVSDRTTERNLLENLAQEDPELVDEIRRLMFVFEDIAKLRDKDIQTILKNVETSQWAMALKGASDELKQKILGNMSQRAAKMLEEEMEFLGAVRLSEVESTQQQIVEIVRRLEDAGEISTHAAEEEEELVE